MSSCDKKRAKLYLRKVHIYNIQLKPFFCNYINYYVECS